MYYSEEEANKLGSGQNLLNLRNRIASDEIISRTLAKLRNIAMGITEEDEEAAAEPEDSSEEEVATTAEEGPVDQPDQESTPTIPEAEEKEVPSEADQNDAD